MKAFVDKETCIGCEACASISPEIYSMNDEGKSVAIEGDIPEDKLEAAQEGRDACPVDAISIHE